MLGVNLEKIESVEQFKKSHIVKNLVRKELRDTRKYEQNYIRFKRKKVGESWL